MSETEGPSTPRENSGTPPPSRPEASRAERIPIAGIGASAGGLEPITALLRRLSADGMAFVILQHLAPAHESMLSEILARDTSLRVVTVTDGIGVERGKIYVAPPGVEMTLQGGAFHLFKFADEMPRHSIDRLFRSMATDLGELAIGVVLSGVGSDGTLGLRAIKSAGGIALAQEPSTAGQAGMPQSAIDAGCVDSVLTPAEIGDELMRLAAHPYVARAPRGLADDARAQLLGQLRQAYGVDFTTYKPNTIDRRIERRMALRKVERLEDYLAFVRDNPGELGVLYSDLLIGVTSFFRDREPFELLKATVFPQLLEHRAADAPVRIWVPGCSTGEEAFSVAMCLLEYLAGRSVTYKIQIFATDIDDDALTRARQAIYAKTIALDLAPERLQRFFVQHEDGYQVSRQVRDLVMFAHHNLGKDPPFSRLDLVTCRNVLIYMQPALQQKVLHSIHYALNPDAYLLLGSSESVGDASGLFSLVDRKLKLYTKKNIASAAVFEFAAGRHLAGESFSTEAHATRPRAAPISALQLADRKILDRFGPPGVLIDHKLDVVQFRGHTAPFFAPLPGPATLNVLKLIRPELLIELRGAIAEVAKAGIPVATEPVRLADAGDAMIVIEVIPIQEGEGPRTSLLVLFRDAASAPRALFPPPPEVPPTESRMRALERELLVTKEYLQTSVQELQGANEELQSANEELQSANEELQSSTEELETSKEELQSTNEELSTVNEELQNRMVELGSSNDDLQNVLADVGVAVVIVGVDLRLRRFSVAAEKLLNLIPGDVGRPVAYLATALNAPQLEATVAETIHAMSDRAQRVRCSDGQWYTMRSFPYRTADHTIRGALLEFLRAPPGRKLGDLPEVQELAGKVLSTLPDVLMLVDDQLRVVWVNRAFFDAFQVGAEVLGRPLDDLWETGRAQTEIWTALEEAAAGRHDFDGLRVEHPLGREGGRPMIFAARCIAAEQERPALALIMMKELEETKEHPL